MSTDSNPPKKMPSVAEINAYLEQSAARTKLRLPLAKGAARVERVPDAPSAVSGPAVLENASGDKALKRALPVQVRTQLPTQGSKQAASSPSAPPAAKSAVPSAAEAPAAAPGASGADSSEPEAWSPFSPDDDH